MSDDPHTPQPAGQAPAPHAIYEHWCCHPGCESWGSFGFARNREITDWYCGKHRPQEA